MGLRLYIKECGPDSQFAERHWTPCTPGTHTTAKVPHIFLQQRICSFFLSFDAFHNSFMQNLCTLLDVFSFFAVLSISSVFIFSFFSGSFHLWTSHSRLSARVRLVSNGNRSRCLGRPPRVTTHVVRSMSFVALGLFEKFPLHLNNISWWHCTDQVENFGLPTSGYCLYVHAQKVKSWLWWSFFAQFSMVVLLSSWLVSVCLQMQVNRRQNTAKFSRRTITTKNSLF